MCPNYEPEGQGRGSTFRMCHALKKIAILLNKSLIPSHLKWPALYKLIWTAIQSKYKTYSTLDFLINMLHVYLFLGNFTFQHGLLGSK